MTRWSMAILGLVFIAAGVASYDDTPPLDDWQAVKAWYSGLSEDESESCAALEVLARAGCLMPDNRDRDAYDACVREYTPASCGGDAQ